MPFPISVSGVVTVRVVTVEAALDQLERALALQKACALQRQGNEVHFRGGAVRWVSNWNVLVPISKGVLHVQPRDDGVSIFYRVTFSEMLIAVTVMMAGVRRPSRCLLFASAGSGPHRRHTHRLVVVIWRQLRARLVAASALSTPLAPAEARQRLGIRMTAAPA